MTRSRLAPLTQTLLSRIALAGATVARSGYETSQIFSLVGAGLADEHPMCSAKSEETSFCQDILIGAKARMILAPMGVS
jgi:hypothetical protein